MRIDIWSDIICPFCIIGKRHLELALEDFPHAAEVDIHWHSFELDPKAADNEGATVVDLIADKYGISREESIASQQDIARRAEQVGLHFNWEEAKPGNTFNAHRLIHAAREYFSRPEVSHNLDSGDIEEAFIRAYFTEGKDISDPKELKQIALSLGMDEDRIDSVLSSEEFGDIVRTDELHAQQIGITGVPFFLVENKWAINGAQPVDMFRQALQQIWEQLHPNSGNIINLNAEPGDACGPDGC